MNTLPDWVQRAIRDAIEGAIVALGALSLAVPNSLDDAKAQALIVATAIGGAVLAAARRAILDRLRYDG